MSIRTTWLGPPLWALLCLALAACGSSTVPGNMLNEGSWYITGFRWPHDGNPYESGNFLVYSDAASEQARQTLAELGETLLVEFHDEFGTSNASFLFPRGQSRIHIYAYKNRYPSQWGGWSYYGGMLIYSLDHPQRASFGHTAPHVYAATLRHELTHVFESLLKASNDPRSVDVWLTEGIAEVMSGGTAGEPVKDAAKLNALIARFGLLNPVSMHAYDYPDIENVAYDYYYPMFQLAVTYLLDPNGHGRSMRDLRDLFLDVRGGVSFSVAFERRLGIGLREFEATFFDRMSGYLP